MHSCYMKGHSCTHVITLLITLVIHQSVDLYLFFVRPPPPPPPHHHHQNLVSSTHPYALHHFCIHVYKSFCKNSSVAREENLDFYFQVVIGVFVYGVVALLSFCSFTG